ncbi:flippase [Halomonas sp. KM-1]|uniref:flippase n=1 Tax=Halomonas sp. KM-1 TaxID=590061 RepID=UPI0002895033|nr:flippase [Halomonas sp. KM-1]
MIVPLLRQLTENLSHRFGSRDQLLKIIANTGWLFGDRILRMGVGLVVMIAIARYLGPADFGLLNYALAFVALFTAIGSLGLNEIVTRELIVEPSSAAEILGTAFVLQLISGILASLLIAVAIVCVRDDPIGRSLVILLAPLVIVKSSQAIKAWYESRLESKYVVWVENGVFLIFAVVNLCLILLQAPLQAFAWALMIEGGVAIIGLLAMFAWRGGALVGWRFRLHRAGRLLANSWPLILSGLAIMVYMRIDQIMLGQMIGDEAVGIYTAATRISEVWYFIPVAIVASVYPALMEGNQLGRRYYLKRLQTTCDFMVLLAFAVAVPMTILSSWAVVLLFGPGYHEAGPVLAIHIWASVFVFLGLATHKGFLVENLQRLSLYRTLLGAVINVFLNLVLIPRYGVLGAAVATVCAQALPSLLLDILDSRTRHFWMISIKALCFVRHLLPWVAMWKREAK